MLLHFRYKIIGLSLVLTGLVLTILFFTINFRFEIPVFAILSSYIETKFFATFSTNFADESILLILVTGLTLVVFSKEKKEMDFFITLRHKALEKTVIGCIIFLFFAILFFYGNGFVAVGIFYIYFPFILYLIVFNILKFRELKKENKVSEG